MESGEDEGEGRRGGYPAIGVRHVNHRRSAKSWGGLEESVC